MINKFNKKLNQIDEKYIHSGDYIRVDDWLKGETWYVLHFNNAIPNLVVYRIDDNTKTNLFYTDTKSQNIHDAYLKLKRVIAPTSNTYKQFYIYREDANKPTQDLTSVQELILSLQTIESKVTELDKEIGSQGLENARLIQERMKLVLSDLNTVKKLIK